MNSTRTKPDTTMDRVDARKIGDGGPWWGSRKVIMRSESFRGPSNILDCRERGRRSVVLGSSDWFITKT